MPLRACYMVSCTRSASDALRLAKQAARMFSKILAAIEVFVRMIGWWVLLPNWWDPEVE